MMSCISSNLPQSADAVSSQNKLRSSGYFPVRTNEGDKSFDWEAVTGFVIKLIYRKELLIDDIEEFKSRCKESYDEKLDDVEFFQYLEKMYFSGNNLFKITPELLLFKARKVKGNTPNSRLGEMFSKILQGVFIKNPVSAKHNFLEQVIVGVLQQNLENIDNVNSSTEFINEMPYLPFISESFGDDLMFLSDHPKYFLSVLTQFLKLYAYLYTAQLGLNINSWRKGEPTAKPLYFILDTEKASSERIHIRDDGHHRVHSSLFKIYPYLSMAETLQLETKQNVPIWMLAKSLIDADTIKLINYAKAFKEERRLGTHIRETVNPLDALEDLLKLSAEQFEKGQSRHAANNRCVKKTELEICNHFIKSRGRGGRVLVINQDYLLLLTNISIGVEPKLRFHELLEAFKKRGVFFDKRSQQALIQFYERIGNVERMSDSGDAVYVRKTI